MQLPYEDPSALNASEALVVRLLGDEHPYTCVLRTRAGITYTTRFATRHGYNTVRLPFNIFRPVVVDDPPLQPGEGLLCVHGVRGGGVGMVSECSEVHFGTAHVRWQICSLSGAAAYSVCFTPPSQAGEVEYIGFRFEPRIKVLEEVRTLAALATPLLAACWAHVACPLPLSYLLPYCCARPGWTTRGAFSAASLRLAHTALPLLLSACLSFGIVYPKSPTPASCLPACSAAQVTEPGQSMFDASANRFKLMVDWIKTLPGGVETDFVLLSCSGAPRPGGLSLGAHSYCILPGCAQRRCGWLGCRVACWSARSTAGGPSSQPLNLSPHVGFSHCSLQTWPPPRVTRW